MTPQDTKIIYEIIHHCLNLGIGAITSAVVTFLIIRFHLASYLTKKGENQATKEDIKEITEKTEEVKLLYSSLLEKQKARHQLRLAALEKRLDAHQRAFVLWRNLYRCMHTDELVKTIIECQTFWENNLIYLEPEVREAFLTAYICAGAHKGILDMRDSEAAKENWRKIVQFPDVVLRAVELPPLSCAEKKIIESEKHNND